MFSRLIKNSSLRPSAALRSYYTKPAQGPTTKGEAYFVAATFPDDYETESQQVVTKVSAGKATWDEAQATISEADVKADRGEVQFGPKKTWEQERTFQPEADLEPKLDEM